MGDVFQIVGLIVLGVLVVLLVWIQYTQAKNRKKSCESAFDNCAEQRGLSDRERHTLMVLAKKAGLKRAESIFTIATAYDRGVERMLAEHVRDQNSEGELEQLKIELAFLREKMGFKVRASTFFSPVVEAKLSTRQIPIGKKLYMVLSGDAQGRIIKARVAENTDDQLIVRLGKTGDISPGTQWAVQCYSGASILQFSTWAVTCHGKAVELQHTTNVQVAGRRRFPRVSVLKPAFIARFSFGITPVCEVPADGESQSSEDTDAAGSSLYGTHSSWSWGPPRFVPATVTELAGPGLWIESQLFVGIGERVLVVLGLDDQDVHGGQGQDARTGGCPSRMLEDVGVVRHASKSGDSWSLAVELIGLSDSNVDELIHITNVAGIKQRASLEAEEANDASIDEEVRQES